MVRRSWDAVHFLWAHRASERDASRRAHFTIDPEAALDPVRRLFHDDTRWMLGGVGEMALGCPADVNDDGAVAVGGNSFQWQASRLYLGLFDRDEPVGMPAAEAFEKARPVSAFDFHG